MTHLDWHLGRPGPGDLSFDLPYHWLSAAVTVAPVAWLVLRRWPARVPQASVFILGVGLALGQGLEPLGEVIHFPVGWGPFTNVVRWRVFAEFLAAALVSYLAIVVVAARRHES